MSDVNIERPLDIWWVSRGWAMSGTKPVRRFTVEVRDGTRWRHLRVEAHQDNSPRYNVRRFKVPVDEQQFGFVGGFLEGFMFGAPEA